VINNAFGVGGNFNASLLATEGIASVGPLFAPVAALAGGLVIGLGNRLSEGLSQRFRSYLRRRSGSDRDKCAILHGFADARRGDPVPVSGMSCRARCRIPDNRRCKTF